MASLYKKNPEDQTLWVRKNEDIGVFAFSFDGKRIYNLFADYPYQLTKEEKEIFDRENPFWADFFKERVSDWSSAHCRSASPVRHRKSGLFPAK